MPIVRQQEPEVTLSVEDVKESLTCLSSIDYDDEGMDEVKPNVRVNVSYLSLVPIRGKWESNDI